MAFLKEARRVVADGFDHLHLSFALILPLVDVV
jgi:hypothetical protein